MKRTVISLALITLFTASLFAQGGAATTGTTSTPAGPAPNKVAVINIQQAIFNTNQGKRDTDALTKKFEPKRLELVSLNDEIEKLKKDLQDKQNTLSDDEKNNRARVIDKKTKDLQRQGEDAQNDYNQQLSEIQNSIGSKMLDLIDKFSRSNGIGIVVDVSNPQQSQVLWAHEGLNITPEIVKLYDDASGIAAPPPAAPSA